LQKERYEADLDREGKLEQVHLEPKVSPAVSIPSVDDTDSTKKSEGEHDSAHYSDVNMHFEDDVGAPGGVDLDSDVDM
jgi:hypothetical protein